MPYKSKEKLREYQREWARKKRLGLPTRTTEKLSENESKWLELQRERRYRNHKKKIIKEVFGNKCFFCDRGRLIVHRKDGKPHKKISDMSIKQLLAVKKEDYVVLCYGCHKAVHWVMEYFGLTWEEIIKSCG